MLHRLLNNFLYLNNRFIDSSFTCPNSPSQAVKPFLRRQRLHFSAAQGVTKWTDSRSFPVRNQHAFNVDRVSFVTPMQTCISLAFWQNLQESKTCFREDNKTSASEAHVWMEVGER
jgi:hypothetical protein